MKRLILLSIRNFARVLRLETLVESAMSKIWDFRHQADAVKSRDINIEALKVANESLASELSLLKSEHEMLISGLAESVDISKSFDVNDERGIELSKLIGEISDKFSDPKRYISAVRQLRAVVEPIWLANSRIGTDGFYQTMPFYFSQGERRKRFDSISQNRQALDTSRAISFMHMMESANALDAGGYGEFGVNKGGICYDDP